MNKFTLTGYLAFLAVFLLSIPSTSATPITNICHEEAENIWQSACNLTILTTYNGSITNSASCWIKILFPNSTVSIELTSMTNSNTDGLYYYPFNFSVLGHYTGYSTCAQEGTNATTSISYNSVTNLTEHYLFTINQTTSYILGNQTKYELIIYSGGVYNPTEQIKIIANLLKDKETVEGETLRIEIAYPNGLEMASATMTDMGNGIYKYNTTAPSTTGDYLFNITISGYNITRGSKFTVSSAVPTIEAKIETKGEEVISETETNIQQEARTTENNIQTYMYGLYAGFIDFINHIFSNMFLIIMLIIAYFSVLILLHFIRNRG